MAAQQWPGPRGSGAPSTTATAGDSLRPRDPPASAALGPCDVCGADAVIERRCKILCLNCGTILQSCADL